MLARRTRACQPSPATFTVSPYFAMASLMQSSVIWVMYPPELSTRLVPEIRTTWEKCRQQGWRRDARGACKAYVYACARACLRICVRASVRVYGARCAELLCAYALARACVHASSTQTYGDRHEHRHSHKNSRDSATRQRKQRQT
eukprot:4459431-Pleurochrysis_carterae.AAC.1